MKTLSVVVAGRTGRMGREIESIADECEFKIVGGLGRKSGSFTDWLKTNAAPDVVIDFSLPEATRSIVEACVANRIPLVSGVTGLSENDFKAFEKGATQIPILYSANMSIGIQILAEALEALKSADGFDFSIEDIHHRHKKDRPSGTAVLLNEELRSRTGRPAEDIVSIRGGGVIGVHRVLALSESESIIFEHTALNRTVFARGACRAARWVVGRGAGLYSLRDTL